MRPMPRLHQYGDGDELAAGLAGRVAARLAAAVEARGGASLAVSGGSTPGRFLDALSHAALDWSRVAVTLVDERCVAPDSARSNARLIRHRLLRNAAAPARFVPLYDAMTATPEMAASAAARSIASLCPLEACILGMGTDGHTASFFPDGDNLQRALDPHGEDLVLAMHAPGAPEPRLTLVLPVVIGAGFLALHIEGADKKAVLQTALESGPAERLPVRAVLDHAAGRLEIFWAP